MDGPKKDHEYARGLTEAERERKWPNVRPRNAATLILLDRKGKEAKVLMGKRHEGHKFMPGKFVFPGGRIESADRLAPFCAPLPAMVEEKLLKRRVKPAASRPRALALAAIRETFEETGLLLGRKQGAARAPAGPWADFVGHGVTPDLSGVSFIARAITPPKRPKRFDTTFLSMDATAIAERIEGVVTPSSELVELVWVPLKDAQALDLPHITRVVLKELDARSAQGMGHELPVPFYFERNRQWFREEL
ncbi:MAG: NUDIX hydrolase [Hyphomicrobiales bacterium]|nr:NUDIX hydrolase [Hyphomicrobiales bacterium]